MLSALLALPATVGAIVATWLLVRRASNDRLLYLIAWSVTLVGLSLALLAMTVGLLAGFNGPLFRVVEIGAALLAPMWLALGMVELVARYVQIRFSTWLFVASYTVIALVILVIDPTVGSFGDALPKPGKSYGPLPLFLIDGAHVLAVLTLVVCAVVTALLASRRDEEAAELLIPVALVALAGVLVVAGTRGMLPGPVAALALGGAAGLVWYGAMRTIPVYEDDEDYADGYADEPATGYEDQGYAADVPAAPPAPEPRPAPAGMDPRGDLRFPEPDREELRFPEPAPAAPTSLDGPPIAAALGVPPGGVPAGTDLSAARGQITVYTLLDGREDAFDRAADELVRGALAEPDALVLACHTVANAPTQRIIYRLFRDEASFTAHQRQPHLLRFLADVRSHVLATNVIDLRLGPAKVPPAAAPSPAGPGRFGP
ncbi:putative quinol monooxygenase [Actinomadura atramentaria]|uniref:putative quinol monooxygenase n=1 Tax=Actinomadura atramentaria TaxID=1990 RepID=UPI00035FCD5C|nr:antibiotic biosynthesis monooxygenase [Actinomadura atramentaria]